MKVPRKKAPKVISPPHMEAAKAVALTTAAEKVSTTNWGRTWAVITTFVLSMGGGHVWTQAQVATKIDDKATEQKAQIKTQIDTTMMLHYRVERARKDSIQAIATTRDSADRQYMIRQNDTMIALMRHHAK